LTTAAFITSRYSRYELNASVQNVEKMSVLHATLFSPLGIR